MFDIHLVTATKMSITNSQGCPNIEAFQPSRWRHTDHERRRRLYRPG
jgi:hypothetical protein